MGTRNLTVVYHDGYKVAQYGQWDGYPEGAGKNILEFLRSSSIAKFKSELTKVSFLSEEDMEEIMVNHTDDGNGTIRLDSEHDTYWKENLQHLSRDTGWKILQMIYDGKVTKLKDSLSFVSDSLFCEWCYVIDLNKNQFEIYQGFNQKEVTEERFSSKEFFIKENHRPDDEQYHPVKLVKSYNLYNLPSKLDFLFDMEIQNIYTLSNKYSDDAKTIFEELKKEYEDVKSLDETTYNELNHNEKLTKTFQEVESYLDNLE